MSLRARLLLGRVVLVAAGLAVAAGATGDGPGARPGPVTVPAGSPGRRTG